MKSHMFDVSWFPDPHNHHFRAESSIILGFFGLSMPVTSIPRESPWYPTIECPTGTPKRNQLRHRTGLAGPLPCSGLVANAAVCSWCRSICGGDWDDFERAELGCPKIMGKPWETMGKPWFLGKPWENHGKI